ncbi:TetR family transcriptional regulator [Microbacterium oxydans]|jgi:AcrR family transcriptional regulator|uniref:Putative HTH-type transcriptional regulator YbiH n=1 Tax=Microbacterium oxydans TaxID=82380 RepID=A0A147E229_9MICO|nr:MULTISPECIES: TetR family transcriptional regulator [Microbacterium]AZS39498.1 putative HTH-type transcriptional regulator YbiH [Microbacterium oxydans]KTR77417.1 TetR family transcriptional regulator [Microbacterium oxydans]MBE7956272.1 TetR family transcriptional regulator [Microbacterium sp. R1]
MTEHKPPRRRGRPRGVSDSRARIIASAVDDFGEKGYDGATIRSIAARAGVDSALVHHYFGTKADLFAEAVGIPLRPDIDVPGILTGPRDEVGERLIRYVLEAFEQPEVRRRGVMLLRTAIGSRVTTPLLAGFLSRELLSRISRSLDVDDADLRASLVASQIAGMLIARYVLKLPALAAAPVEDLVARLGPTVQRYLFD